MAQHSSESAAIADLKKAIAHIERGRIGLARHAIENAAAELEAGRGRDRDGAARP